MKNDIQQRSRSEAGEVVVQRVTAAHAHLLPQFFARAWGASATGTAAVPQPDAPAWLCLRNGEPIAYLGSFSGRCHVQGAEMGMHWLKGFWVLPEYQSGPIGFMLLRSALRELGPVAVSLVALPARRLLDAAGVREHAVLFNRLLVLRPGNFLARLDLNQLGGGRRMGTAVRVVQRLRLARAAGFVVGVGQRLQRLRAGGTAAYDVREGWAGDDALDELWQRIRNQSALSAVRDAVALRARYDDITYRMFSAWKDGTLQGWTILRNLGDGRDPRLGGLRVAVISDVLFPVASRGAAHAAIAAAEVEARRQGADALLCSGTDLTLERVLMARGFLRTPANLHLMTRGLGSAQAGAEGGGTWITRGDGRSDEGF